MATFTCWEIAGELFQVDALLLDAGREMHAGLDGTEHIDGLSTSHRLARGALADTQRAVQDLQRYLEGLVTSLAGQNEPTGIPVALPYDVGHRIAVAGSLERPHPALTEVQRKESSGTTNAWAPARWPVNSAAVDELRQWLEERNEDEEAAFCGIDLDLRGADLSDADFSESWLSDADLRGVLLRRVDLYCSHAERADFSGADMEGADLVRASLWHANFTGARLVNARFGRAEAFNTVFVNANLSGANFGDGGVVDADLTGADLTGARANKLGLTRSRLTGATVAGFHGSVIGPIVVSDHGKDIELDDEDLERWFAERGATVTRFHAEPPPPAG